MINGHCEFSPCRKYRYTLWRVFYPMLAINPPMLPLEGNQAHNYCMFIGLNPSTADETRDDPTVRRCIEFAKSWGYGALCMTNIFAWRATDPEAMKSEEAPIGPSNNRWLTCSAAYAGVIVAAWGKHGSHRNRGEFVRGMVPNLHYLELNKDGSPRHPLYLKKTLTPKPL